MEFIPFFFALLVPFFAAQVRSCKHINGIEYPENNGKILIHGAEYEEVNGQIIVNGHAYRFLSYFPFIPSHFQLELGLSS